MSRSSRPLAWMNGNGLCSARPPARFTASWQLIVRLLDLDRSALARVREDVEAGVFRTLVSGHRASGSHAEVGATGFLVCHPDCPG